MNVAPPLFTVVTPLYNKGAHVTATLASVAAQTFSDYEVIVVDDGSTDDGPDQVARMGGRIRLVRQPNAGPGAARNRGVSEARGSWIAFLDADDLWGPDHLATIAQAIADCPDADVIATGFVRGDGTMPTSTPTAWSDATPRFINFLREPDRIWTSAVAARAAALRVTSFGTAWPGEDVDLWLRLALGHRFAVVPKRTSIYVQRTGGVMDSQASPTAAVPIARQPIFVTLTRLLADPTQRQHHADLAAFRNRLLLDYVRPSLFNGQVALARDYLAALRQGGGRAPRLYRMLALLPNPIVRTGSRAYGGLRRRLSAVLGA